jgi:hypothetical protein
MKVVRLSALRTDCLYPTGNITGIHFCYRLSRPQSQRAARKITSMKNSSDTIGTRTCDLPACTAVPPTNRGLAKFEVGLTVRRMMLSPSSSQEYSTPSPQREYKLIPMAIHGILPQGPSLLTRGYNPPIAVHTWPWILQWTQLCGSISTDMQEVMVCTRIKPISRYEHHEGIWRAAVLIHALLTSGPHGRQW